MSDPGRGLRAIGMATLALEAVVLLLALVAAYGLHRHLRPATVGVLLGLTAGAIVLAPLQRRRAGPPAGLVLQVLVVAAGVITWPLYLLGAVFAALWMAYLRLRRYADRPGSATP